MPADDIVRCRIYRTKALTNMALISWISCRFEFSGGQLNKPPKTLFPDFATGAWGQVSEFCIRFCRAMYELFYFIENRTRIFQFSHKKKAILITFCWASPHNKLSTWSISRLVMLCNVYYYILCKVAHAPGRKQQEIPTGSGQFANDDPGATRRTSQFSRKKMFW